jgi:hypothetical protein
MFVGPLAKHLPFGMDVGFEMGMVAAGLAYLVLRPIERRSETAKEEPQEPKLVTAAAVE